MTGETHRSPQIYAVRRVLKTRIVLRYRFGEGTRAKCGGERAVISAYEKEHPHPETSSEEDALFRNIKLTCQRNISSSIIDGVNLTSVVPFRL